MRGNFFDLRKLSVRGFGDNLAAVGSESFVRKKYTFGRPNNSPESTVPGVQLALKRIVSRQNQDKDDDAFFGVHIKETIQQIRTFFGRR